VSKNVLQSIGQLECIDIAEPKLYVGINDKFSKTKNFTAQMECISETRLLTLLGCECPGQEINRRAKLHIKIFLLDWLQVHVVIKVKIIQVLQAKKVSN